MLKIIRKFMYCETLIDSKAQKYDAIKNVQIILMYLKNISLLLHIVLENTVQVVYEGITHLYRR